MPPSSQIPLEPAHTAPSVWTTVHQRFRSNRAVTLLRSHTPHSTLDSSSTSSADSSDLVARARAVALRHHGDQRYGDLPYGYHLEQVAAVLTRFGLGTPELLAAAWLHDVIEDTDATSAELAAACIPARVIALVEAVTDEPGATRDERKAKTYPKTAALRDAVALKLADRIANVEAGKLEGGGKVAKYAREQPAFRAGLHNPAHGLDALWRHLETLFATSEP